MHSQMIHDGAIVDILRFRKPLLYPTELQARRSLSFFPVRFCENIWESWLGFHGANRALKKAFLTLLRGRSYPLALHGPLGG